MGESSSAQLNLQLNLQRQFFATGKTKELEFRYAQLANLRQGIQDYSQEILEALHQDLGKSTFEAYSSEIFLVLEELKYVVQRLRNWAKPQRVPVRSPLLLFSTATIAPEPLGVVLIIAPWNYPFQLSFLPLIGAIAAGNCAILKPSEIASHTATVIAKLISACFPSEYITAIEGGIETSQALLAEQFDHIFFTGGTAVGKIVMTAAAAHLTPVTLELGGKSPCIVDASCDLDFAARKIAWGKCFNAGQTCIAPDYLLVDQTIKSQLIEAIKAALLEFYGADPAASPDYGRIVSFRQFARLTGLIAASHTEGEIICGGQSDALTRYIAPTLVDRLDQHSTIMQEEIFGPILPILSYETLDQAIALVNSRPKPLALYFFSNNRELQQQVLSQTSSGSACINNIILQSGVPALPFGGVGSSGMGSYHGKASFDTFSHRKSILASPSWFNFKWLYPPYKMDLDLLKRFT